MWMAVKRGIVVAIGLLIQILLTLFIYLKFGEFISIIQVVYGLLSIIIVLMIIKYYYQKQLVKRKLFLGFRNACICLI